VKVAFENNSVKYFFSVATNAFCRQTFFKAEAKFVINLYPAFHVYSIAIFLIFKHYAILKFY